MRRGRLQCVLVRLLCLVADIIPEARLATPEKRKQKHVKSCVFKIPRELV